MDDKSLESLRQWSNGRSAIVSLVSAAAMSAVDEAREFLTMRRTKSDLFEEDPVVNEAAWLNFYNAPKSLEQAILALLPPDGAEAARSLLNALRNPRGQSAQERLNAFGVILSCFADSGSNLWSELARLTLIDEHREADSDGEDGESDETPLAFYLWVYVPCWLVHGVPPTKLMRRLSEGGQIAELAAERLVRLDPRVARHPQLVRWVNDDPAIAKFRREKLRRWSLRSPFDKEKSESHALRLIAGFVSDVSELFDERILAPEIRALVASLGAEVPADCHAYLLARTEDDWSREVRRRRGHFELVQTRPDKSILAAVRELAGRIA